MRNLCGVKHPESKALLTALRDEQNCKTLSYFEPDEVVVKLDAVKLRPCIATVRDA